MEDIDFADDITLVSHRQKDMQDKTSSVGATGSEIGLKVNIPKTKSLRANQTSDDPIILKRRST